VVNTILTNRVNTTVKPFNNPGFTGIVKKYFTPECIFLILSLFFGILFVFLTPPFQVPDEVYHYYRSYEISEFHIWTPNQGGTYGDYFPGSIIAFPGEVWPSLNRPPSYKNTPQETSILYQALLSQINVPLDQDNVRFFFTGNIASYSPVGYLPQAAGMLFARWLNLSPLLLFYCGRLANLGVWIFLIYSAIRKIPFAKWLVLGISLMPMSIYQSASLSPDALNNGLCILFIAYVIYFAVNKNAGNPLSKNEILLLLIMCLAISLIKGYFFLSFLLFILPSDAFSSKKEYWFTVLGIGLLSAMAFDLWYCSTSFLSIFTSHPILTKSSYLYSYGPLTGIVTNPAGHVSLLLTTFYSMAGIYCCEFIGIFGWLTLFLPTYIYIIFFSCLVVLAFIDNAQTISLTVKQKMICITVFVILAAMIATQLSIWIPGEASVSQGIQGRYFIPIALLCFLAFNNSFLFKPKIKKIVVISVLLCIIGILFFALYTICQIFYISQIPWYSLTIILVLINAAILVCCYVHFNPRMQLPDLSLTKSVLPVFMSLILAIGLSLIMFSIIGSLGYIGVFQTNGDTSIGPLFGGITAGQTFYSPYPNLDSIDILFATYNRTNTNSIIFHLRESPDSSTDITTITVNAREIKNNSYYVFKIPKISDSENKSYYFFIESPDSIPGDAIAIRASKDNVYSQGSAYINSNPLQRDWTFVVHYAP
jgi:uncharacterized membrane protein